MSELMLPDSSGAGPRHASIPILHTEGYDVDIDELRSTANRMLDVADRTDVLAGRGSMSGASSFGSPLSGAAHTWGDRYAHLLRGLADEIEHAGYQLRGTADAYYEVELTVEARLRGKNPAGVVP